MGTSVGQLWSQLQEVVALVGFVFAVGIAFVALVRLNNIIKAADSIGRAKEDLLKVQESIDDLLKKTAALKQSLETDFKDKFEDLQDMVRVAANSISELKQLQTPAATVESPPSVQTPDQHREPDYWSDISREWKVVSDEIDDIRRNIEDGRKRRKYVELTKHDYPLIIDLLAIDDELSEERAAAAQEMHGIYKAHRNRRIPVSRDTLNSFFENLHKFRTS